MKRRVHAVPSAPGGDPARDLFLRLRALTVNDSASPSRSPRLARLACAAVLCRPALDEHGRSAARATWLFVNLPKAASAKLPSRATVAVEGTLNGAAFSAALQPDGQGGHWLKIDRALQKAAGVKAGEKVLMEFTPASKEPEPEVPPDVRAMLRSSPSAHAAWKSTTALARRDWVQWITSGKKAETRAIRLDKARDMLEHGKRRPCCFDRSGMYSKSMSCPVAADD